MEMSFEQILHCNCEAYFDSKAFQLVVEIFILLRL